jgi:hypothetical protein
MYYVSVVIMDYGIYIIRVTRVNVNIKKEKGTNLSKQK